MKWWVLVEPFVGEGGGRGGSDMLRRRVDILALSSCYGERELQVERSRDGGVEERRRKGERERRMRRGGERGRKIRGEGGEGEEDEEGREREKDKEGGWERETGEEGVRKQGERERMIENE